MSAETNLSAVWPRLAAALYGLDATRSFEQWVYANAGLEGVIGEDPYFTLISLDYGAKDARHEIAKAIEGAYAARRAGMLPRDLAIWVTSHFLEGELDLVTTSRVLARLWNAGASWSPSEFAYIDSELDDIPMPAQYHRWDPAALKAKLAAEQPRLQEFQRAAVEVARQLAVALEHPVQAF